MSIYKQIQFLQSFLFIWGIVDKDSPDEAALTELTRIYRLWCESEGLEALSADELLMLLQDQHDRIPLTIDDNTRTTMKEFLEDNSQPGVEPIDPVILEEIKDLKCWESVYTGHAGQTKITRRKK